MIEICGAVLAKRSLSKGSIEDQLGDLSIEVIGECVAALSSKPSSSLNRATSLSRASKN